MDHPFYEVVKSAEEAVNRGSMIYQKWTCRVCGKRLTMTLPNTFHKVGHCDECGSETDLVEQGCGFMLVHDNTEDKRLYRALTEVTDPRD